MKKHLTSRIPQEAHEMFKRFRFKPLLACVALVLIVSVTAGCATVNPTDSSNAPATSGDVSNTKPDTSDVSSPDTDSSSDESNVPVNNDATFGIGDTAEYKDVQVTFTNVSESSGSDFNKPGDGNIFVLAEFEIANNGTDELSISSMLSFDAYQDSYSTELSLSALMEANGQLDGTIAAGKKMKGSVGYEVPADYKELEINVQLDMLSNDKLVFVYSK